MEKFPGSWIVRSWITATWREMRQVARAVWRAFGRGSHLIKGRKRLYASSLAFKTALALVPALAVLMAVLSAETFAERRAQVLDKIVDVIYPVETAHTALDFGPPEPQDLRRLKEIGRRKIHQAVNRFADHAQTMGAAGLAAFLAVLFLLLRDVEDSFNFLWALERRRSFLRQLLRHSLFLVGAPLLAAVLLAWKSILFGEAIPAWKAVFFIGTWVGLTAAYQWVPNTRVQFRSAVWGGFLACLLLSAAKWGLNFYVLHGLSSSKVYGALWMVPLMLLWFYLCWTIVLFGVEVAFFLQQQGAEVKKRGAKA